ncbi:MAG: sensor histidine kinase, partial [Comamonadaceae bacterium]
MKTRPVPGIWLAVLLVMAAVAGCAPAPDGDLAVHIRQAQLLRTTSTGFPPAPPAVDAALLAPGPWQVVILPHISARGLPPLPDDARTLTDWYRLDLAGMARWPEPPFLYIPRWKNGGQIAVYAEGRLLHQTEGSLTSNGYNRPLMLRLSSDSGTTSPATVL